MQEVMRLARLLMRPWPPTYARSSLQSSQRGRSRVWLSSGRRITEKRRHGQHGADTAPGTSIGQRPAMVSRFLSLLAVVALLIASGTYVEANRFYRKDKFTVEDLLWCQKHSRPPSLDTPCMDYMLGVADLVHFGEVRFKGKRVCRPKTEPLTRERLLSIVMKRERLTKWDPRAPAAAFIVSALAEAFPCKK